MKTVKLLSLSVLTALSFTSCTENDDTPDLVNEEEVITTLIV